MAHLLAKELKRIGFVLQDEHKCSVEYDGSEVSITTANKRNGHFCYNTDEAPEFPVLVLWKKRKKGIVSSLVVMEKHLYFRKGGWDELELARMKKLGCKIVEYTPPSKSSRQQAFKKSA